VTLRGRLMHEAGVQEGDGSMVAVLGAGAAERAPEIAGAHGLVVANDNSPQQVVLSGPKAELPQAIEHAKELGLRATELDVTGAGWAVGVNYRTDKDGAEAVVADIEQAGGSAVALGADVSDPDAPDTLFSELESRFDCPVLVLVNNAGISADDLTPSLGDDAWESVIDTNLTC